MRRAHPQLGLLATAAIVVAAACTSATADAPFVAPASDTVEGIGRLPETIPGVTFGAEMPIDITLPPLEGEEIGLQVAGNRLLMVGDSIFAGVSRRYTNLACDTLVPLNWQVLVEAEPGRFVEFGRQVLDRRLDEGWDAVVFMFGSNYRLDRQQFADTLGSMITDVGDVPVVLLTTSMFREVQREVNEVIREFGDLLPNVTVLDWETISAFPGVLSGDRLHPTEPGQRVMMAAIAQVLGPAPIGPGECLRSSFNDDSAVGSGTIVADATAAVAGTRSAGTSATPTGPGTTAPPTVPATDPPPTVPQPTAPPTQPPATQPPSTDPPPDTTGD
jgi:hypothetical protein